MGLFDVVKGAWSAWKGDDSHVPLWTTDEEAFFDHFGTSYEDFAELVSRLDQAHSMMYEKTSEVNPEAAVLWVFFICQP